MGREFELKYRADAAAISRIREAFDGFTPITMETAYYDTPDRLFSRLHWTLRRRYENGSAVCTLKTPAPDRSRGEWEVARDDIRKAIPELCKLGAPEALLSRVEAPLEISCGARFTRLAKTVALPDAVVELALDRGILLAGGAEAPFAEVEVELKEGSEESARSFAEDLAAKFGLAEEPLSKHKRAMLLAQSR